MLQIITNQEWKFLSKEVVLKLDDIEAANTLMFLSLTKRCRAPKKCSICKSSTHTKRKCPKAKVNVDVVDKLLPPLRKPVLTMTFARGLSDECKQMLRAKNPDALYVDC